MDFSKYKITIKNNIALFQKGPLSNWYGAYRNQADGQFKIVWNKSVDLLIYRPKYEGHPRSYDECLERDAILNNRDLLEINCNCAEQAMMLSKALLFKDTESANKIILATDPKEQKAIGRGVAGFKEEVWESNKFYLVYRVVLEKFRQNESIRKLLCRDLKNYILAEAAPWDKIWGIGLGPDDPKAWNVETWQGESLLGKALMRVRMELE